MKKLYRIFLSLMIILSLSLIAAGCGHEHDFDDWEIEKEPSCTEEGLQVRVCLDCDYEKTKKIPATGHQEGEWITDREATCTADGSKRQVCSLCSETIKTETLPAVGNHDYSEKITAEASCISDGTITFTCSRCSDSYVEPFPAQIYTATELYELYKNSVGEIITYDKSGSELALGTGFVYTDDGRIITNCHVIEYAYSAAITINGTRYQIQQVLAYDKDIDLAVLKISAQNLSPVKLCDLSHSVGEVAYALGSSKGLTATFSDGIITYTDRIIDGVRYTQHDAPISSGNSGGPLINKYGEVIGINTWTVRESQNLNFAICTSELDNLRYSTPLTMAQFYEKESTAFLRLKNYIQSNGTYSSSDDAYVLVCDEFYSANGEYKYTRMAYYYISDGTITLDLAINDGEDWVYFEIDEDLAGAYFWEYFNDDGFSMYGTIYAATYDEDTWLGYSYTDIPSAIVDGTRNLASSMVDHICGMISEDFAAIGVTAKDLGFLLYS